MNGYHLCCHGCFIFRGHFRVAPACNRCAYGRAHRRSITASFGASSSAESNTGADFNRSARRVATNRTASTRSRSRLFCRRGGSSISCYSRRSSSFARNRSKSTGPGVDFGAGRYRPGGPRRGSGCRGPQPPQSGCGGPLFPGPRVGRGPAGWRPSGYWRPERASGAPRGPAAEPSRTPRSRGAGGTEDQSLGETAAARGGEGDERSLKRNCDFQGPLPASQVQTNRDPTPASKVGPRDRPSLSPPPHRAEVPFELG